MINALTTVLKLLVVINDRVLRVGKAVAWVALAVMVVVILIQIFFRYLLNNALPWPDEAARFLMLWMTGLIAPLAYRHGGFVAIEMVPQALSGAASHVLTAAIHVTALCVIAIAIGYGWDHTMGFGGNFDSSSLKIPLDLIGLESVRVKLRYMYGALFVGMVLLLLVNIELLLRHLIGIIRPDSDLPQPEPLEFKFSGSE